MVEVDTTSLGHAQQVVARVSTWIRATSPIEGGTISTVEEHDQGSELSDTQLRVRALERVLTEKGYLDPAILDEIVETFETRIGPHIGARIVAKAWLDPRWKMCGTAAEPASGRQQFSHAATVRTLGTLIAPS